MNLLEHGLGMFCLYYYKFSRVSARRDTCCIVALSFNLQKKTNPVIWFQESLPFDCFSILPVPEPIGECILQI